VGFGQGDLHELAPFDDATRKMPQPAGRPKASNVALGARPPRCLTAAYAIQDPAPRFAARPGKRDGLAIGPPGQRDASLALQHESRLARGQALFLTECCAVGATAWGACPSGVQRHELLPRRPGSRHALCDDGRGRRAAPAGWRFVRLPRPHPRPAGAALSDPSGGREGV
jgi:hypothetical protein